MKGGNMLRIILLLAAIICGCAPTSNLNHLNLGMTKSEAQGAMGDSGTSRGAKANPNGSKVEVLEYALDDPYIAGAQLYWLHFTDGKLDRWGKAGDWDDRADQQIDINVKTKE